MSLPERIGRYEIVEELGHGAMGSVFKARDPMVGRIVALKTIHSAALAGAQSEEYRERFYREARASGVLAHPGIVPVFDVGDHEGAPFLVMEFVDGRTLGDAIKKGERFSLDHVCEIGQQIAEALGYAHRKGVIHRDVKPANILLTSREVYGKERPRITDFGIAKLAASEITTTGQLLGTPSFMAPEQFTGSPVDGRADLFSLGVILYSLATGEQPFAGETMTAVSYKIVYTEPIPPSKLNPALPPRLEAVILKCLAKNPAERYSTGEEVAQDLAAIRASAGSAALAAPAVDADATLGPAALAASASVAQSLVPGAAASKTGSGTGTGTGTGTGSSLSAKKPAKPLSFETIFSMTLLAIAGLAAALAGTWFMFEHIFSLATRAKEQTAITQPAPPPQPIVPIPQPVVTPVAADQSQPPAAATPASATPAATVPAPAASTKATTTPATPVPAAAAPKPAITKPKTAAQNTPAAQSAPPPATVAAAAPAPAPAAAPATPTASAPAANAPAPHPAAAAFNPRTLDPNASTKLKIDTSKFPSGLPFTVEMNKQTYLRFITGDGTDLENLYVPAGVQEFRVLMKSGGQEHNSNVVSDNFKAKKHRTLRIQIMDQGNPAPKVTLPLGKDAQLYLSLN